MKSVSELAKELNTSVNNIYQKINNTLNKELKNHITTSSTGVRLIDDDGVEIIKKSMRRSIINDEASIKSIGSENEIYKDLIKQNIELLKQMDELYRRINDLTSEKLDLLADNKRLQDALISSTLDSKNQNTTDIQNELIQTCIKLTNELTEYNNNKEQRKSDLNVHTNNLKVVHDTLKAKVKSSITDEEIIKLLKEGATVKSITDQYKAGKQRITNLRSQLK